MYGTHMRVLHHFCCCQFHSSARRSPHLSRVYMDMTMPGVQKPHCDPWLAAILCWTACSRPLASPIPSTVVTASPAHNI